MSKASFLLTSQQTKRIKASVIVRGEAVFLRMVEAAQARLVGDRTLHFLPIDCIFLLRDLN